MKDVKEEEFNSQGKEGMLAAITTHRRSSHCPDIYSVPKNEVVSEHDWKIMSAAPSIECVSMNKESFFPLPNR